MAILLKKFNLITTIFYICAIGLLIFTILTTYVFHKNKEIKVDTISRVSLPNEFGFISDTLNRGDFYVNQNETFSDILLGYDISYPNIDYITRNFQNIFDFRKIIAGKTYHIYSSGDSIQQVQYLVYEKDQINYVVVDLRDSSFVYTGEKKVEFKTRIVSGIINNSLYQTIMDNEVDPELVSKLSEVYAWQIDFYRIQKKDNFKVIFQEEYVDGRPIGIGDIIGAEFNHYGETFYAINFKFDDKSEFFDENGNSLRKAFLKAPVKFSRISSRYSLRRYHPIEHRVKAHLGTDYVAPTGTPIRSTGDGIVIAAGFSLYNGNFVKIKHNSVYSTQYLHMSRIGNGIRKGTRVKQGQLIGYVGRTGEATGPHVCYRFWKNGVQVDPLRQKIPSAHPIDPKYLPEFNIVKNKVITELDSITVNNDEIKVVTAGKTSEP